MEHASWITQLRKGALDAAVLGLLDGAERAYGLQILDGLNRVGLTVTEGALYPLLARLHKAGLVESEWVLDGEAASPRKYFRLTEAGRRLLTQMRETWPSFAGQISRLIEGGRS